MIEFCPLPAAHRRLYANEKKKAGKDDPVFARNSNSIVAAKDARLSLDARAVTAFRGHQF